MRTSKYEQEINHIVCSTVQKRIQAIFPENPSIWSIMILDFFESNTEIKSERCFGTDNFTVKLIFRGKMIAMLNIKESDLYRMGVPESWCAQDEAIQILSLALYDYVKDQKIELPQGITSELSTLQSE